MLHAAMRPGPVSGRRGGAAASPRPGGSRIPLPLSAPRPLVLRCPRAQGSGDGDGEPPKGGKGVATDTKPVDKMEGLLADLKKTGMDRTKAKQVLAKWAEMGVKDPEQLRKLLVKRSLRPAVGLGEPGGALGRGDGGPRRRGGEGGQGVVVARGCGQHWGAGGGGFGAWGLRGSGVWPARSGGGGVGWGGGCARTRTRGACKAAWVQEVILQVHGSVPCNHHHGHHSGCMLLATHARSQSDLHGQI